MAACPQRSYYASTYYQPDGWLLVDHKAEIRVGSVGVAGLWLACRVGSVGVAGLRLACRGGGVGVAAGWPACCVASSAGLLAADRVARGCCSQR